ncbi:hypothetical protein FHS31_001614 [Sphingomonas vulcanisoli]|uniref:Uncharacterized protein n=1 Tax=Sphingomonas vulcanisoli TaxID=1658060 RepID=A0ABX0TR49_9SPHN|nr:hypothetical protein [Sphingomonas vulcanisoli]
MSGTKMLAETEAATATGRYSGWLRNQVLWRLA